MKIIGLTGPTGSGKSLLCDYLSEHGKLDCLEDAVAQLGKL